MVIQRWQSLLLLVAGILMALFCCTPYAIRTAAETAIEGPSAIYVKDAPVFMVLNIVVAALLFIAIFLFKNLKLQMRVTMASILLIAASMVTCGFILWAAEPDAELLWTGGVLLLVFSLVCAISALRFMRKDYKLLRSNDRLR